MVDPGAPVPTGQIITPSQGDLLRNIDLQNISQDYPLVDSILSKWYSASPKVLAGVQLDSKGKTVATLTYG